MCALVLLALPAIAKTKVTDIRLTQTATYTQFTLNLDSPTDHELLTLNNPDRVVIDVTNAELDVDLSTVDKGGSPVRSIRSGVRDSDNLRIVFDLTSLANAHSFFLKKIENGKMRYHLVVLAYSLDPRVR